MCFSSFFEDCSGEKMSWESANARCRHCKELLANLEEELAGFDKSKAVAETKYASDNLSAEIIMDWSACANLQKASILASSIIHHLRSALDTSMYDFLKKQTLASEKELAVINFPICSTEENWTSNRSAGVIEKYCDSSISQWVKKIQPFSNGMAWEGGVSLLQALQEMSNSDKHRSLIETNFRISTIHRVNLKIKPLSDSKITIPEVEFFWSGVAGDAAKFASIKADYPFKLDEASFEIDADFTIWNGKIRYKSGLSSLIVGTHLVCEILHKSKFTPE